MRLTPSQRAVLEKMRDGYVLVKTTPAKRNPRATYKLEKPGMTIDTVPVTIFSWLYIEGFIPGRGDPRPTTLRAYVTVFAITPAGLQAIEEQK